MSVGSLFSEVRAVLGAADPRAAFNASASKNVNLSLNDPGLAAVWQPFRHSTVRTATVLPLCAACRFMASARHWPGVACPAGVAA